MKFIFEGGIMNNDLIIKYTNKVAVYSLVALIYWVFIFLVITVFELRIFGENITEMFYFSLLGIFAMLSGTVILNVMANLSKISTVISNNQNQAASIPKRSKLAIIMVLISFPVICGILFAGNSLSADKNKDKLIKAAQSLITENQVELSVLSNYEFSPEYVKKAEDTLCVIKKIDKNIPEVILILPDQIGNKKLFLRFEGCPYNDQDEKIEKQNFIFSASEDEREYLNSVFIRGNKSNKFSYTKGNYQLYYPTKINGRLVVLYFSDYERYGRSGS